MSRVDPRAAAGRTHRRRLFRGAREKSPDTAIWLSRQQPCCGGEPRTFEPPRRIADTPDIPCWNPVLRCDGGKLILYFKSGHEIPAWRTLTTESDDLGDSFGEIRELVPGDVGGRGPVKNKCIVLHDRTLLAPGVNRDFRALGLLCRPL